MNTRLLTEHWAQLVRANIRLAQRREQLYQQIRIATRGDDYWSGGATRKEVQALLNSGWTLLSLKFYAMREGSLPQPLTNDSDLW